MNIYVEFPVIITERLCLSDNVDIEKIKKICKEAHDKGEYPEISEEGFVESQFIGETYPLLTKDDKLNINIFKNTHTTSEKIDFKNPMYYEKLYNFINENDKVNYLTHIKNDEFVIEKYNHLKNKIAKGYTFIHEILFYEFTKKEYKKK